MCTGTQVQYEQTARLSCTGTLVHYEQTARLSRIGDAVCGQGGGCVECVRVHWYTMIKQSGNEWPGQGGGLCRVCTSTLVYYEQAATLSWTGDVACGQGGGCGECVRVHSFDTSKQPG